METLRLLKQEINDTEQLEHDFAKWKLIVAASLGGAALGLGEEHPHYWLLLFIPFVCAYIDLHCYQYEERVVVISRFLSLYRQRSGAQDEDDAALQAYETHCARLRGKRVFDLGEYANLAASTILSIIAPAIAVAASATLRRAVSSEAINTFTSIWLLGVVLIITQWLYHKNRLKKLAERFTWTEDADTEHLPDK